MEMADNPWLCSHVIAREFVPPCTLRVACALRVHQVGEKSNIFLTVVYIIEREIGEKMG